MYRSVYFSEELPEPFSKAETFKSFEKLKQGDSFIREEIILRNIRLVLSRVFTRFSEASIDKAELVQVGVVGLLKAIDTFDHNKGFEFSTYATKCIDCEIVKFIKKEKKSSLPISLEEEISVNKGSKTLLIKDLLVASDEEAVEKIINRDLLTELKTALESLNENERRLVDMYYYDRMPQRDIAKYLNITQPIISRKLKRISKKLYNRIN